MKTNQTSAAVHLPATPEGDPRYTYYTKTLAEAVEHLVINVEIQRLSNSLITLLYYATNPDVANDFDKESLSECALECLTLLGILHNVYESYGDLKSYNRE